MPSPAGACGPEASVHAPGPVAPAEQGVQPPRPGSDGPIRQAAGTPRGGLHPTAPPAVAGLQVSGHTTLTMNEGHAGPGHSSVQGSQRLHFAALCLALGTPAPTRGLLA